MIEAGCVDISQEESTLHLCESRHDLARSEIKLAAGEPFEDEHGTTTEWAAQLACRFAVPAASYV